MAASGCNTAFSGARFSAYHRQTRSAEQFPDPFCDMASLAMPQTRREALQWCEYLLQANGPYREAIRRIVNYFVTDVKVDAAGRNALGKEEKDKYEDFLDGTLGIKGVLHQIAMDLLCYGNSFTSVHIPFRRYLTCKGHKDGKSCSLTMPFKRVANTASCKFAWSNFQFVATCPHCGYRGAWDHEDYRASDGDGVRITRWSPHEIDILNDRPSGDSAYIWRIPEDYRTLIKQGSLFHLERASWEVIEAIKNNETLLFDDDAIYHMKEETFAGADDKGWGYSRVLTNFRQAWYVQVLQRYNEAIALDYIIPFRLITPMPRPGSAGGGEAQDPVYGGNLSAFTQRVLKMVAGRQRDPARWNVLPWPVQYQALGGEASNLMPKELIEYAMSVLLDAIGIPVELYRGSLSVQSAPVAMRLFEATWGHLVHQLNRFLGKLVKTISQLMKWEPVVARLETVRHADDLNRQMAKLQLMMGGQISKTTGMATVGVDNAEETKLKLEEAQDEAEQQAEAQKKLEQNALMDQMAMTPSPAQQAQAGPRAAAGGAPPQQGGMPPQGGGQPQPGQPGQQGPAQVGATGSATGTYAAVQNFMAGRPLGAVPPSMDEMMNMATILAQQLAMYPEAIKDSRLIQLKRESPPLHALVKSQLDSIHNDAKLRGGAMVMQQEYGKQASLRHRALPVGSASQLARAAAQPRIREIVLDN